MKRYRCKGSVVQDTARDYVTLEDLGKLEIDVCEFVEILFNQVRMGESTPEQGMMAPKTGFRLKLSE